MQDVQRSDQRVLICFESILSVYNLSRIWVGVAYPRSGPPFFVASRIGQSGACFLTTDPEFGVDRVGAILFKNTLIP
jgi:hypothetical protein